MVLRTWRKALHMYRNLNPENILETIQQPHRRIAERFPGSSLSKVSGELLAVSEEAAAVSGWLAKPHLPIYCSEALSVISKIAALYFQEFDDPVTLSAVNDVEELTSRLARKVWQKIIILERLSPQTEMPPPPPGAAKTLG